MSDKENLKDSLFKEITTDEYRGDSSYSTYLRKKGWI